MKDKVKENKNEEINIDELKTELREELKKEVLEEILKENKNKNEDKEKEKKFEEKAKETIDKIMDTEDSTKDYSKKDINDNKGIAMISYLGPLAIISLMINKDSKYVEYHAKQGLNLFVIELIVWLCSYFIVSIVQLPKMCTFMESSYQCGTFTPWWINVPLDLIELFTFVVAIIGFVWAYQGKAKELPVIGKIKIIK